MPLFSEHINNIYYSGSPSYSAPYSYSSSVLPLGSSYSASYLNPGASYSNHSSLGGYSRSPLSSSRWISGGRTYSPILGTITERGASSPVRINSPRRIHIPKRNYVSTSFASRPININTADIDVSRDKYRKKIETVSKPPIPKDPSPEKDNGPFMPRVDGKPETGVDSSPGLQRSTIRRGRTVVRLHTIKRKDRDSPRTPKETSDPLPDDECNKDIDDKENITVDEPTESVGWRERLSEDLTYIDKREKKSLGAKLIEKFILKDKDLDTIPIKDRKILENSESIQCLPVSPSARRKFSLNKSSDRRCSLELLSEQANLLDSLIKSENLSVATLDLTKVGLSDETQNISEQTPVTKRRKSNNNNSPLQKTKSDQSLHKSLKCKDLKNSKQFSNKMRSIKKSSSGGSIRRLDSITEFPREIANSNLPSIEENRLSVKRNSIKTKTKPKLKQKITSSVEICEPELKSPLKFIVENVTVEEKLRAPRKEFTFSSEVIQLPVQKENTSAIESINKPLTSKSLKNIKDAEPNLSISEENESVSPESENGNFWDKIGKRETVYLMKRKQWIDNQKQKNRRALFWFPEDEESEIKEKEDFKVNDDLSTNLTPQDNKEQNLGFNDNIKIIVEQKSDQEKENKSIITENSKVSEKCANLVKDTKSENINNASCSMTVINDEQNNLVNTEVTSDIALEIKNPTVNDNDVSKVNSLTKSEALAEEKNNEKLSTLDQRKNLDDTTTNKKYITENNENNENKDNNDHTNINILKFSRQKNVGEIVVNQIINELQTLKQPDNKISTAQNAEIRSPITKTPNSEEKNAPKVEVVENEIINELPTLNQPHNKISTAQNAEIRSPITKTPNSEEKNTHKMEEVENKIINVLPTLKQPDNKISTAQNAEIHTLKDEEVTSIHVKPENIKIDVPLIKKLCVEKKAENKSTDAITETLKPQINNSSTEKNVHQKEASNDVDLSAKKILNLEKKIANDTTDEISQISKSVTKKLSNETNVPITEKNHKKHVTLIKKSSLENKVENKPKDEITKKIPVKKSRSNDEKTQNKEENSKNVLTTGNKLSNEKNKNSNTPTIENKNTVENSKSNSAESKIANENKTISDNPQSENLEIVMENNTQIVCKDLKSQISGTANETEENKLPSEKNATEDNKNVIEDKKPCSIPTIPIIIESENIPNYSKGDTVGETSSPNNDENEEKKAENVILEKKSSIKLPSPIVLPPKKKPVKDEPALRPLIATPRPLQKKAPQIIHSSSSSESSTEEESSEEEDSEETESSEESTEFFECENNPDGRTSTGSNDSGFDSSVPTSPAAFSYIKKGGESSGGPSGATSAHTHATDVVERELEQSTAYGLFRKTGRFTPPARSIPRFRKYNIEDFNFIKVLGKGSFGKVLLAELRDTEYYYAVKCLKKDVVLEDDDVECTLIERKVLALGTNHPYLCHLFATFQTDSHLFFVMEYLNGGDLMFHIQQSGRFPEIRARFYGAEIVSGLKFLHKRGIVYRDLKLDNILLDFDGHVRIADFGMCKLQIYLDKTADTFCGTPDYMAPEIIKGLKYNQTVDWWSFGVLLYEMLIGQSPFSGCDEDELFWSICNEMPSYPRFLSSEALSILTRLLDKDSRTRLGGIECMHGDVREQAFFNPIHWDRLERRDLDAPFKPRVRHPMDTQYFDKVFTGERPRLTAVEPHVLRSMDQEAFRGFSYTNPNATDR